jgi:hypothetical protein
MEALRQKAKDPLDSRLIRSGRELKDLVMVGRVGHGHGVVALDMVRKDGGPILKERAMRYVLFAGAQGLHA